MEAIGGIASTLQIIGQCAQATITIARWVGQVKTVDERIESFSNEVVTLQSTYQTLSQSLRQPSIIKNSRLNDYDATGHLWMQIATNLRDCERTTLAINQVLAYIESKARIGRPILKQLKESLVGGELARLRQQIQLFNTGMTLPMQMINLMTQLSQRDETSANQRLLDQRLDNLQRTLQTLTVDLSRPRRKLSYGGSTAVAEEVDEITYANMEGYVETAKAFLKSASIAASTRAATSVGQPEDLYQEKAIDNMRRGSAWAPLTTAEVSRIESWGQNLPDENLTPYTSEPQSATSPAPEIAIDSDDEDDEVELTLARTLLRNGHDQIEQENYPGAEDNFRAALDLVQSHDFGNNIACSPADVTLLLAQCCMKQQKYDEAITRLEPLAAVAGTDLPQPSSSSINSQIRRHTDKGQALFASHMLGEVYLRKSDFINAERHTLKAHKGRRKLLGPQHPKTLESVQLAIDMYQAKGSEAMSNAYREFLKVPSDSRSSLASPSLQSVAPTITVPESPPQLSDAAPAQKRKPTFSIPMPFRKSEKGETLSRATPTNVPRVSFTASNGPADSTSQFSSSPGNRSSFSGVDPLMPPNPHALRKSSTYSSTSTSNEFGWSSVGEEARTGVEGRRRTNSQVQSPSLSSTTSRQTIEPKFLAVRSFCQEGKHRKAVDMALTMFSTYDRDSAILVHRSAELEKNIKKSDSLGLAGTGHGYAPIHFFCSLKQEALAEVQLLIEHGANINAVAYKAGYKNADPFTPLTAAIERGHVNLVRLLLESEASIMVPQSKTTINAQIDRNSLHPLLFACRRSDVGIVSLLLDHGAVVREEEIPRNSWHGNSLLHEACWRCNIPMVEFLLDYQRRNCLAGRSLSATVGRAGQQDAFGMTPLMYAIDMRDAIDEQRRAHKRRHRVECLKLLLEDDCEELKQHQSSDEEEDAVVVGHMDGTSPASAQPTGSGSDRLATDLYLEDKKGHTVFWYANEEKDPALTEILEMYSRKSRLIDFE